MLISIATGSSDDSVHAMDTHSDSEELRLAMTDLAADAELTMQDLLSGISNRL